MEGTGATTQAHEANTSARTVNRQIRGSGLLLSGNALSVGINFLSQVLIVRHLSTANYGEWVYALSVVLFCQGASRLGTREVISRFVPIFHERNEHGRMFGVIVLMLLIAVLTCGLIVAAIYLFPQQLAALSKERHQLDLLLVLIFLVPSEALDNIVTGLLASFHSAGAIFFRRHIVAPGLKLLTALVLIAAHGNATLLAYGYVLSSVIGVAIFAVVLFRQMSEQGVCETFDRKSIRLPFKEVVSFAVPLITADMVMVLNQSAVILLLGYFHGMVEVAFYRVVLPAAMMNSVVITAFTTMYTPAAARMFARQDHEGINQLYWRTAVWMSVLSFPIFALTFCFARPLTIMLYGARYAHSAPILAMLALGYYFNTALGFNGLTLKVIGRLRYVVTINVIAAAVNLGLALLLVPRLGATGGAIATMISLLLHNMLKQAGLRLATGVSIFEMRTMWVYAVLAVTTVALSLFHTMKTTDVYVSVLLAAAASIMVFALVRKDLRVGETFPEALRFAMVRRFFS